jgi:hypothetical protein
MRATLQVREAGGYPTAREIYRRYMPGASLGFRSERCASAVQAVCGAGLAACDKACMRRCTEDAAGLRRLSADCARRGGGEPVVLRGAAKAMPAYEIWQRGAAAARDPRLDLGEHVEIEEGKKETRRGAVGDVPLGEFLEIMHERDVYSVGEPTKQMFETTHMLPQVMTPPPPLSSSPHPPHPRGGAQSRGAGRSRAAASPTGSTPSPAGSAPAAPSPCSTRTAPTT